MFEALNIQSADFSADYKDSKGRTYQEFLLDQDLTMTLVMGYSIELRHKVAKRWRELEEQAKKPAIPQPHSHSKRNKVTHLPESDKITVLAILESLLHAGKTSDSERTVLHRKAAWSCGTG
ncbi:hypothetical protein [Symbiopectobacterium purcellii]|uniref:hypothetical protein n=1 Tax=Symbiopectobacterium purcellii TaxID=2871826 RepID=UPI003F86E8BB